jgi:hypothetical protein
MIREVLWQGNNGRWRTARDFRPRTEREKLLASALEVNATLVCRWQRTAWFCACFNVVVLCAELFHWLVAS